jgi:hypothetical protein
LNVGFTAKAGSGMPNKGGRSTRRRLVRGAPERNL